MGMFRNVMQLLCIVVKTMFAFVPNKDSDEPSHLPNLIRIFTVHMENAKVLSYSVYALQRLCCDWTNSQADLSLFWLQMPHCCLCRGVVAWLLLE